MFLQLKIKQSCAGPQSDLAPLHHNMRITSHCLVFGHSHTSQCLTHTDVHISIYLWRRRKKKREEQTNKMRKIKNPQCPQPNTDDCSERSYLSCVAFFQKILSSFRKAPSLPWVRMLCRLQRGVFGCILPLQETDAVSCVSHARMQAEEPLAGCPVTAPLIWTPANLQEPSFRSWRLRSVVKTNLKLCWSVKDLMSPSTRFCQSNVSGRCKILKLAIKVTVDITGYYFVLDVITEARTGKNTQLIWDLPKNIPNNSEKNILWCSDGISGSF